jgi:hypothetical protein
MLRHEEHAYRDSTITYNVSILWSTLPYMFDVLGRSHDDR